MARILLTLELAYPFLFFVATISTFASSSSSTSSYGRNGRSSNNHGDNNNAAASFSPIRELGPSLAASVAGGTVIAVRSPPPFPFSSSQDEIKDGGQLTGIAGGRDELVTNQDDSLKRQRQRQRNEDECIVLLFKSPPYSPKYTGSEGISGSFGGNLTLASVFGHAQLDNASDNVQSNEDRYQGLSFLPNGPVNLPWFTSNDCRHRNNNNNFLCVLHAPSGLVIAGTGFAPDVDHLIQVATGKVLGRISIYDSPPPSSFSSFYSGKSVDPHRLVRQDLSSIVADAAMAEGARPYGAQLLVIGQSSFSRRSSVIGNHHPKNIAPSLEMYTIDPTGGWRNWNGVRVGGTAVGRNAPGVRASLLQSMNSREPSPHRQHFETSHTESYSKALADNSMEANKTPTHPSQEEGSVSSAIDPIESTFASKNPSKSRLSPPGYGWKWALENAIYASMDTYDKDDALLTLDNNDDDNCNEEISKKTVKMEHNSQLQVNLQTKREQNYKSTRLSSSYGAIVIFGGPLAVDFETETGEGGTTRATLGRTHGRLNSRCAVVHTDVVKSCYRRCIERLQKERNVTPS